MERIFVAFSTFGIKDVPPLQQLQRSFESLKMIKRRKRIELQARFSEPTKKNKELHYFGLYIKRFSHPVAQSSITKRPPLKKITQKQDTEL